jgi:hypothetical protein
MNIVFWFCRWILPRTYYNTGDFSFDTIYLILFLWISFDSVCEIKSLRWPKSPHSTYSLLLMCILTLILPLFRPIDGIIGCIFFSFLITMMHHNWSLISIFIDSNLRILLLRHHFISLRFINYVVIKLFPFVIYFVYRCILSIVQQFQRSRYLLAFYTCV